MIKPIKTPPPKPTILIADDEPEIVKFFCNIFSKEGYRVINAQNGRNVLKRIKKGDIDLVILDVVMPDMNGIKVLRELRKITPKVAVILLSAYGTLHTAKEAMLLGAQDYITKPFDIDFMKDAIKQALRKRTTSTLAHL